MRMPRLKQRRHRTAEWLSSLGLDLTLELPLALEGIAQWAGWTYLGTPTPSPKLLYAGGRHSSRLVPTTEFPTFRVDSSPYRTGIEPATTILKAVCFTPDPLSPFSFAAAYAGTRRICSRGQATWECLLPTRLEKLLAWNRGSALDRENSVSYFCVDRSLCAAARQRLEQAAVRIREAHKRIAPFSKDSPGKAETYWAANSED